MQVDDRLAAGVAASGAAIAVALAAMEGANTFVVIASSVMGALLALMLLVPIGLLVSPILLFIKNRGLGYSRTGSILRSFAPLFLVASCVFALYLFADDAAAFFGGIYRLLIPIGIGYLLGIAVRHVFKKGALPFGSLAALGISFAICIIAILGYTVFAEVALGASKQPVWVGFWSLLTAYMAYVGLRPSNQNVL